MTPPSRAPCRTARGLVGRISGPPAPRLVVEVRTLTRLLPLHSGRGSGSTKQNPSCLRQVYTCSVAAG